GDIVRRNGYYGGADCRPAVSLGRHGRCHGAGFYPGADLPRHWHGPRRPHQYGSSGFGSAGHGPEQPAHGRPHAVCTANCEVAIGAVGWLRRFPLVAKLSGLPRSFSTALSGAFLQLNQRMAVQAVAWAVARTVTSAAVCFMADTGLLLNPFSGVLPGYPARGQNGHKSHPPASRRPPRWLP